MYFILLIFTLFLYRILSNKSVEDFRLSFTKIMSIVLIVISGLRNKAVGSDTGRYLYSLEQAPYKSWDSIFSGFQEALFNPSQSLKDPGYAIFEKLVSIFTTDQVLFLLLIAAITLIPTVLFIKNNTIAKKDMIFPYMFFITLMYENFPNHIVRMSIAFALCMCAYMMLNKNKSFVFFLFVFLAATIHKSALILVVFWILQRFVSPKLVFYSVPFFFFFVYLRPALVVGLLEGSSGAYQDYLGGGWYESGKSKPIMILLLMGVMYLLLFIGMKSERLDVEKYRKEIIGASLAIGLTPVVRIDPIMFRLVSYFAPWLMLLIPVALDCISDSNRKMAYFVLSIVFLLKAYSAPEFKFFWQYMPMDQSYTKVDIIQETKVQILSNIKENNNLV